MSAPTAHEQVRRRAMRCRPGVQRHDCGRSPPTRRERATIDEQCLALVLAIRAVCRLCKERVSHHEQRRPHIVVVQGVQVVWDRPDRSGVQVHELATPGVALSEYTKASSRVRHEGGCDSLAKRLSKVYADRFDQPRGSTGARPLVCWRAANSSQPAQHQMAPTTPLPGAPTARDQVPRDERDYSTVLHGVVVSTRVRVDLRPA